jgi:histone-lysine N-methyltransferase SETD3
MASNLSVKLLFIFALFSLCVYQVQAQKDAQTVLSEFASWLSSNGVQSKVNLGVFDGLRFGGVAGTDIKDEDPILQIPEKLILSEDVVMEHPVVKLYSDYKIAYEPLMIYILHERLNPDSFWLPYFQILPTDFSFHPYFWSDEDLSLTIGTGLPNHVRERKAFLLAAYNYINDHFVSQHDEIFPDGYFSYENYVWAFMVVLTRAWKIDNQLMLVPLADMLNHHPTAGTGNMLTYGDEKYFQINATRDYETKEQVYDNYGGKTNFELLKGYGFILEDNPYNGIHLNFELKTGSLISNLVEPLLSKADPNYRNLIVRPNRRPDALLRVSRLSVMEFSELEYINDAIAGKPVTLINELRAYRGAISALTQSITSYPTTIQEDIELLEDESLTDIQRTAITFRKIEKEVTQNCVLVLGKLWENILLEGKLPLDVALR